MIADSQSLVRSIREEVTRRRREIECLEREALHRAGPVEPRQLSAEGDRGTEAATAPQLARLCLQAAEPPARPHLRHLLGYYDRRFVELAYRVMLQRPMDPGGEWFVEQLRKGQSRLDILLQLQNGPEGKQLRAALPGLAWHRLLHRLRRLPVIGWIYRAVRYVVSWFWCLATLPRLAADAEKWRQHTMALLTNVEENLNQNYARIEDSLGECAAGAKLARSLTQRLLELQCEVDDAVAELQGHREPAAGADPIRGD